MSEKWFLMHIDYTNCVDASPNLERFLHLFACYYDSRADTPRCKASHDIVNPNFKDRHRDTVDAVDTIFFKKLNA